MQPRAISPLSLPLILPFYRAWERVVVYVRKARSMVKEHSSVDEIGAYSPSDVHAAKRWPGRGKWRRSIYETRRRDTIESRTARASD